MEQLLYTPSIRYMFNTMLRHGMLNMPYMFLDYDYDDYRMQSGNHHSIQFYNIQVLMLGNPGDVLRKMMVRASGHPEWDEDGDVDEYANFVDFNTGYWRYVRWVMQ